MLSSPASVSEDEYDEYDEDEDDVDEGHKMH